MSSYIISKQEYMKAAGLVSGIAEVKKVWLYDFEKGRNSTPEDYVRKFTEVYNMNAESVIEQYHGDEVGAPADDPGEYKKDFKAFYNLGKQLCYNGGSILLDGINELNGFFASILYQIDNDELHEKASSFLNKLLVALYRSIMGETNSWSRLEIEAPKQIYTPIF